MHVHKSQDPFVTDPRLKIAVFVDFDNIEIGVKSTLNQSFDIGVVLKRILVCLGDATHALGLVPAVAVLQSVSNVTRQIGEQFAPRVPFVDLALESVCPHAEQEGDV